MPDHRARYRSRGSRSVLTSMMGREVFFGSPSSDLTSCICERQAKKAIRGQEKREEAEDLARPTELLHLATMAITKRPRHRIQAGATCEPGRSE